MGKNVTFHVLISCDVLHQIYCTHLGEPSLRVPSSWLLCVQDSALCCPEVKCMSTRKGIEVRQLFSIKTAFNIRKGIYLTKPPIVNQQCVVYGFQCDLCDAGYVGYARVHLHNRVKGHKQQSSAIAKHYKNMRGTMPRGLLKRFQVLKKCRNI